MVARLGQLMQDADTSSRLGSRGKYRITEILFRHHLRTRERKQDTSRTNLLERFRIQLGIASQGIAEGIPVFGKGGRVEDNQVILVAHPVEELESVFCVCLMARVVGEIQLHILVGQVDCLRRAIHRMH